MSINFLGENIMFSDYHIHTIYSDDSLYPMEKVIQDAIKMNMEEICITDHVDYGIKIDWDKQELVQYRNGEPLANVDYPKFYQEITTLQKRYQDQINIKIGMEFGIQKHTIPQFETLFQRYPFDFIILSIHQVDDQEFWTGDYQKGKTEAQYYERYYQEMYDVITNYRNYSVLGHMDLIKRYDDHDGYDGFTNHLEIITKILTQVIADGKGIELNTSSIRYGLDDLMPSRELLQLYYDLGGRIITIGSDSHKPEHLGSYIEDMKKDLKDIGFEGFCTFKKMKPIFHKL